jgi:hypothetical protein
MGIKINYKWDNFGNKKILIKSKYKIKEKQKDKRVYSKDQSKI